MASSRFPDPDALAQLINLPEDNAGRRFAVACAASLILNSVALVAVNAANQFRESAEVTSLTPPNELMIEDNPVVVDQLPKQLEKFIEQKRKEIEQEQKKVEQKKEKPEPRKERPRKEEPKQEKPKDEPETKQATPAPSDAATPAPTSAATPEPVKEATERKVTPTAVQNPKADPSNPAEPAKLGIKESAPEAVNSNPAKRANNAANLATASANPDVSPNVNVKASNPGAKPSSSTASLSDAGPSGASVSANRERATTFSAPGSGRPSNSSATSFKPTTSGAPGVSGASGPSVASGRAGSSSVIASASIGAGPSISQPSYIGRRGLSVGNASLASGGETAVITGAMTEKGRANAGLSQIQGRVGSLPSAVTLGTGANVTNVATGQVGAGKGGSNAIGVSGAGSVNAGVSGGGGAGKGPIGSNASLSEGGGSGPVSGPSDKGGGTGKVATGDGNASGKAAGSGGRVGGQGGDPQGVAGGTAKSNGGSGVAGTKGSDVKAEVKADVETAKPTPKPDAGKIADATTRKDPSGVLANKDAEEYNAPDVDLPSEMRQRGIKGSVRIKVTIEVDGSHEEEIIDGSGDAEVDELIKKTLRRWKWRPALKDGVKVRQSKTFKYTITFKE